MQKIHANFVWEGWWWCGGASCARCNTVCAAVALLTRPSWNVLIVYVASSMTSMSVTCMMPQYVSVPRFGQYWSHFICKYNMTLNDTRHQKRRPQ